MSTCSKGFNAPPGAFGIDVGVRRSASGAGRVSPWDSFAIMTSAICGLIRHPVVMIDSICANDPVPAGTGSHHVTVAPGHA